MESILQKRRPLEMVLKRFFKKWFCKTPQKCNHVDEYVICAENETHILKLPRCKFCHRYNKNEDLWINQLKEEPLKWA